ncbi:class I SAM-dependent methyltransferase [Haloarchaeobius iranensis]|uniref:Methyltransferase domain-containing protein n=1 Tax=Haloarchaeobius iranensis TaxID=996166 RepID=A0A1G9W422_9EURY|nr:class I SAM-dependent methyltransferase [Haloarchaeobius iranensis]SDM79240.1 Methyltransferase domain-containing protein [Haloarchaeobius iranensis]
MDRSPRGTRSTYDRIADHFAQTREYAWPEVESFLENREGVVGLDLGCGNGRHAELLAARCDSVVGLDISGGLLATAQERARERDFGVELVQADAARLPLATGSVDLAVYVATVHHLPTREARRRSLDELARVLSPDGTGLVSAWSTAHDRFDGEEPERSGGSSDSPAGERSDPRRRDTGFDTTVDWTLPGGETVPRFYHVYSPAEFDEDLGASDLAVVSSRVSSGNCYATVTEQKRP